MKLLVEEIAPVCLHSLWIGAALALLLLLCRSLIPDKRSSLRYLVSYFILLLIVPLSMAAGRLESIFPKWQFPFDIAPFVTVVWASGFLICLLKLGVDFLHLRTLRESSVPVDTGELAEVFASARETSRSSKRIRLVSSPLIDGPLMIGWIAPVVVIPTAWLSGVPLDHLRSVFAHELAHAKRLDFAANLLQRVLEAALFFNPAVRWIGRVIREEREHACDDIASSPASGVSNYSRALVWFESFRNASSSSELAPALGNGNDLSARIRRLVRNSEAGKTSASIGFLSSILLAISSALTLAVLIGGTSTLAKGTRDLAPVGIHVSPLQPPEIPAPIDWDVIIENSGVWIEKDHPLFTSIPIIRKGDLILDLRNPEPRLFPELPNQYLFEHQLPFLDGTMPHRDPDGDGFTVIEEYQAKTDPKSADSHPAYANKLKFLKRQAQVYQIKFSARPDAQRFQLHRIPTAKWPKRDSFYLRVGETTADGQIRIDGFAEKEAKKNGIIIDASVLDVTHLPSGKKAQLVRNITESIPTYFAELRLGPPGEKSFYAKEGEEFAVPGDEKKWTLKSVGENECVIFRKSENQEMTRSIAKEK